MEKRTVLLERMHVLVGPQLVRGPFPLESPHFAGMHLAYLKKGLQEGNLWIKMAAKPDDGRWPATGPVNGKTHHHVGRQVRADVENTDFNFKACVVLSDGVRDFGIGAKRNLGGRKTVHPGQQEGVPFYELTKTMQHRRWQIGSGS